jgi:hypothetical protein
VIQADGAVTLGSTLAVTGDVAVNTNKFTVTASSGNTLVAGTLNVTGKTTLAASFMRAVATIAADGSSRSDATAVTADKDIVYVSAADATKGIVLPTGAAGLIGCVLHIVNTANAVLKVYSVGSDTINGVAGATGVAVPAKDSLIVTYVATNTWYGWTAPEAASN